MNHDDRFHGLLVEFDDANVLEKACAQVRDAGYKNWDAHTPLPVHGMDAAMGIRGTRLPWIVLGGALAGLSAAWLSRRSTTERRTERCPDRCCTSG